MCSGRAGTSTSPTTSFQASYPTHKVHQYTGSAVRILVAAAAQRGLNLLIGMVCILSFTMTKQIFNVWPSARWQQHRASFIQRGCCLTGKATFLLRMIALLLTKQLLLKRTCISEMSAGNTAYAPVTSVQQYRHCHFYHRLCHGIFQQRSGTSFLIVSRLCGLLQRM